MKVKNLLNSIMFSFLMFFSLFPLNVNAAEEQTLISTETIPVYNNENFEKIIGEIPEYGQVVDISETSNTVFMKVKSGEVEGYVERNKIHDTEDVVDELIDTSRVCAVLELDIVDLTYLFLHTEEKVCLTKGTVVTPTKIDKNNITGYYVKNNKLKFVMLPRSCVSFIYDLGEGYKVEHIKEIPLILQGNYLDCVLKGDSIASSGCGYCSSAMLVSYLNDEMISPLDVASKLSKYYISGAGVSWTMFTEGLPNTYGIILEQQTTDIDVVKQALSENKKVICSQGPGIFTKSGHIIVLAGIKDGKILVKDPASEEKSIYWDPIKINQSAKAYWIYQKKQGF